MLPSPTTLFWAASDLLRSGTLFRHVSASIERVLVGFALAALVGLTLGVVLGWFRTLSTALIKPTEARTSHAIRKTANPIMLRKIFPLAFQTASGAWPIASNVV